MKNIQKNKEEIKETVLEISIFTNAPTEVGNKFRERRIQIESSALYLQSLFNAIKALKSEAENQEGEENNITLQRLDDIEHLSTIGYGIAESVLNNASVIYDAEKYYNHKTNEVKGSEILNLGDSQWKKSGII